MRKSSGFITFIAIALCVFIAGNLIRSRKQESSCEHVYGAAVTVKNPTCEDEGAKKMECLICGAIYAETIPSKGGHLYVDKAVTVFPTCKTEGVVQRQCLLCNNTTLERIPKSENHTFDSGVETDGAMLYTCTVCGFTQQGEVHKHKDVEFDGICNVCGVYYDVFADESAYTEVDVIDGEYVAGNWYRFYRPSGSIAYSYSFNVALANSQYEQTLAFLIKSAEHFTADAYISYVGESPGASFVGMKSHITDEYIDLYLAKGVYTLSSTDSSASNVTAEITEEATISIKSNGAYIKRLQINE